MHVSFAIAIFGKKTAYFINQVADGEFDPFSEHSECFEFHIYWIEVCAVHTTHTLCIRNNFYKFQSSVIYFCQTHCKCQSQNTRRLTIEDSVSMVLQHGMSCRMLGDQQPTTTSSKRNSKHLYSNNSDFLNRVFSVAWITLGFRRAQYKCTICICICIWLPFKKAAICLRTRFRSGFIVIA